MTRERMTAATMDDLAARLWEAREALLAHQELRNSELEPAPLDQFEARRAETEAICDRYWRAHDALFALAWRAAGRGEYVQRNEPWEPFSLETPRFALRVEPDYGDPWQTRTTDLVKFYWPQILLVPRP